VRLLLLALLFVPPQADPRSSFAPPARASEDKPNILFLIADDWGYGHAGVYGDKVVRTPTFDKLAADGVLFTRAFCSSPSCTPSRAAILTGQPIHRLDDTGNLWSRWPARLTPFSDLLAKAGYAVGLKGKGWGPGDFKVTREFNPAGPPAKDFDTFLKGVRADQPFCFWFGSTDPHRAYVKGSGVESGMKLDDVVVPPYFPDLPEVRSDIADYYFEVQRFDRDCGAILAALEASGRAANTLVVVTSDNGMPFPRCKANCYDSGARMPLAIRWPSKVKGGRTTDAFTVSYDFAPTFLEAAGLPIPAEVTGRSLLPLLVDGKADGRDRARYGRERHANVRKGDLSYPVRVVRTADFAYLRNFRPDRWPGGDPEKHVAVGPFGDCDDGPTKQAILARRDQDLARFFRMAFEKRPEEELYDLTKDPHQLVNVAPDPAYASAKAELRADLDAWMKATGDPRAADPTADPWDKYFYVGK
jgi:arylsulfatase A-like enzyme